MENRTKREIAIINLVTDFEAMRANGEIGFFKEKSYLELIEYYEKEMQVDKALDAVNHALDQFQYRSDFYIVKARLLFHKNDYTESLALLDHASTISPSEFDISILRSRILASSGAYTEALSITADLEEISENSSLVEVKLCQSYIYEIMHDYEAMFQSLKSAIIIAPQNETVLERIWLSVELSKNFEESILIHNRVIDTFPYTYLAWFNLGHAHACVGEYELAIDALEYSFLINKDFEAGYLDCAELCFQMKMYAKALDIYVEANDIFGPDSELLVYIAQCQYYTKDYQQAKLNLKKAILIDPYNDEAFHLIAKCHMKEENWIAALDALKQALYIDDQREEYLHCMARSYMSLGDFRQAKVYYKKAANFGLEQAMYWEEYISFLIKLGDLKDAENSIRRAEVFTYSDKLLFCKAIIQLKSGLRKDALASIQEALSENSDNFKFFQDLAPEYNNDQEIQSAIRYFLAELKD